MIRSSALALIAVTLLSPCSAIAQQKSFSALELISLAQGESPELPAAITHTFTEAELSGGTAVKGRQSSFFFAIKSSAKPLLIIDDEPGPTMQHVEKSQLWRAIADIPKVGNIHSYYFCVGEKKLGGSYDLPVFDSLAYLESDVPRGTLSAPFTNTSKIYDGMKTNYWVYVPAQYDPKVPAPLLVVQDGRFYLERDGNIPLLNFIDNLITQKKIPAMIVVLISPGNIYDSPDTPTFLAAKAYGEKWNRPLGDSMRSVEYDTVSDRYPRFLRDELLPEIDAHYNIRKDAYSRAIMGLSSGAICAFNMAWQMPDQFSRVISWIGSFVSLEWQEDPKLSEGGQDYPDKVLRGPKRNLRVWLQDGSRDQQSGSSIRNYGSWPAANLRMANALKLGGYDFRFSFGAGGQTGNQGAVELGDELTWLWRNYDPAKTSETFEQDAHEASLPAFRFTLADRETDK